MEFQKYSFPISVASCREMIETSREHPTSNQHSRYLVDFIKYFKNGILEKEPYMTDFRIRATNGLVYLRPKKANTVFMRATAVCTDCYILNKLHGKYSIIIEQHPFEQATRKAVTDYVSVVVNHHLHSHKPAIQRDEIDDLSSNETSSIEDDEATSVSNDFNIRPEILRGEERDEVNCFNFNGIAVSSV